MSELQPQTVNLQDILDAKERRAQMQAELRSLYNSVVISITVNMPGKVKYNEDTVSLVYGALDKVRLHIRNTGYSLREERIYHAATGPGAIIAVQGDAPTIKALAVSIEEEAGYSRLLDIDVFDSEGQQINRAVQGLPQRSCLVCSGAAVDCMRAARHTAEEVSGVVRNLITHHRAARVKTWPKEIEIIGSTVLEAMLLEAACAPAPGLVDRFNSGAHQDMDIFTFMKSSSALAPAMYRCALAAWNHSGSREGLLPVLRCIGAEAETAMFQATEGVNTQKGLLFLLGVVAAAAALAVKAANKGDLTASILREAANICNGIVERELGVLKDKLPARRLTAGERFYLSYGITGIRGEIEAGLPVVSSRGLPSLREALHQGLSLNDSLVHTLICLMTEAEDTTILNRHGLAVLQSVQSDALEILRLGGMYTEPGRKRIEQLDQAYSERSISPGGSADLLAVTYFLHTLEDKLRNGNC